jgi:hypothetical protein
MKLISRLIFFMVLLMPAAPALASDINEQRAHFNYQMFCQGCHTATGVGGESVPRLQGYMGNFLILPEGREFLVQVPGSANSSLNDEHLAEVLNWMLLTFSGSSLPTDMQFYQAEEVARLRQQPLNEVEQYRAELVAKISEIMSDK